MSASLKAYLNPHLNTPPLGVLAYFFPPQAFLFMVLLVLMAPMTLLTAESLFIPLFESVRGMMVPEAVALHVDLPWQFYFKFAIFLALTFLGFFQLILRIKLSYYQIWAQAFSRPDPLHVDYAPEPQQSMLAALSWNFYRVLVLLAPPVVMIAIACGVGFLELYFFNQWIHLPAVMLPVLIIVFLFIVMILGLLSMVLVVHSIWRAVISAFGDAIVITEPDLPANMVMARCRRIAFASPFAYALYPVYFLFWVTVLAEVVWLLITYDASDLISFQFNFMGVFVLMAATLAFYLVLNFAKLCVYHDALKRYYRNLPQAFRDRFGPPPQAQY